MRILHFIIANTVVMVAVGSQSLQDSDPADGIGYYH